MWLREVVWMVVGYKRDSGGGSHGTLVDCERGLD